MSGRSFGCGRRGGKLSSIFSHHRRVGVSVVTPAYLFSPAAIPALWVGDGVAHLVN